MNGAEGLESSDVDRKNLDASFKELNFMGFLPVFFCFWGRMIRSLSQWRSQRTWETWYSRKSPPPGMERIRKGSGRLCSGSGKTLSPDKTEWGSWAPPWKCSFRGSHGKCRWKCLSSKSIWPCRNWEKDLSWRARSGSHLNTRRVSATGNLSLRKREGWEEKQAIDKSWVPSAKVRRQERRSGKVTEKDNWSET